MKEGTGELHPTRGGCEGQNMDLDDASVDVGKDEKILLRRCRL